MSDETVTRQVVDSLVRCVRLLRTLGQAENPVVEMAELRLRVYQTGDGQSSAVPGDLNRFGSEN